MLDKRAAKATAKASGPPLDLQEHLHRLEAEGLLLRIDRAIDKDGELHPLVRWQFQCRLREDERRAFLFTNVVDGDGRRYDVPVAVGALAASARCSNSCRRSATSASKSLRRRANSSSARRMRASRSAASWASFRPRST